MKRDNDRKAFLYYTDWAEAMLSLPDDLRLKIDDAIKRYVLYGEEPDDNYVKYSMYSMMRIKIEKDTEAYAERCKAISEARSEAGKNHKGNQYTRFKMEQMEQMEQMELDTDTVTDTNKPLQRKTLLTESKKESTKRTAFVPPSLDEISAYISEKGYSVDAERFFNFYESKGWMVGKTKMKKWKNAVANWEKDEKEKSSAKKERATPQQTRPAKLNYDEDFYGNSSGADKPKPERNYDEGF